uniref:Uncharacterized protein n=1 Tax=Arundo donax TaxID=35708 RepID=A0A0A9C6E8_ARUDO
MFIFLQTFNNQCESEPSYAIFCYANISYWHHDIGSPAWISLK